MNYSNQAGMAFVLAGAALFTSVSYAQQQVDKPGFYGTVGISYATDDNVFRQATSKVSDSITTVTPELLFLKEIGKHQFTAEYIGQYASYNKSTGEDYSDHIVNADLFLDLTQKFNINLQANYIEGHESRGASGVASSATLDVNKLKENRIFTGFSYGRNVAKAQVELDMEAKDLKYTNNDQEYRDRTTNAVAARALYNVSNKTKVFAEVKQNTIDYSNETATSFVNKDSTENFYYAGLRWDASYKTTGELRVGSYDKNFDSTTQTDGSGSSYEASIFWEPRTYSRFTVALSRVPQEAATAESFYVSNLVSVNWDHYFNDKLGLNVNVTDGKDEYTGDREDKLSTAGLGLNYKFRRWLEFDLDYTYSDRDSTDNTADFTDNLFMFTAKISRKPN